jgi:hypothetical protein
MLSPAWIDSQTLEAWRCREDCFINSSVCNKSFRQADNAGAPSASRPGVAGSGLGARRDVDGCSYLEIVFNYKVYDSIVIEIQVDTSLGQVLVSRCV